MSLIEQQEMTLPNAIIDTLKPLKLAHKKTFGVNEKFYNLGFTHNGSLIEFDFSAGIVTLTIVEVWPLRVERVYHRKTLTKKQTEIVGKFLLEKYGQ